MAGRPAKYETAEELEVAVEAYFASISYQEPAVVSTPTGEVDEKGRIIWTSKMLTEPPERPGGVGKPKTVTKWLTPPGAAGLCLSLGISRDTLWRYGKKAGFRDVVERARCRCEEYWGGALRGKSANGAKFALTNCFGWSGQWKDRQEVGLDEPTRKAMSVEQFLRKEEKKGGEPYEY